MFVNVYWPAKKPVKSKSGIYRTQYTKERTTRRGTYQALTKQNNSLLRPTRVVGKRGFWDPPAPTINVCGFWDNSHNSIK